MFQYLTSLFIIKRGVASAYFVATGFNPLKINKGKREP
jgi:hypothetical protein